MKNSLGIAIEQYMHEKGLCRKEFLEKFNSISENKITLSALGFWITGKREPRKKEREILYNLLYLTFNGVSKQKFPIISKDFIKDESIEINVNSNEPINADACFVYKKDNMLPLIRNGDTLFIKKSYNVKSGDIILIDINNDFIVKRIYEKNNVYTLCDENNEEAPLIYNEKEYKKIKQVGIVKYILKKV